MDPILEMFFSWQFVVFSLAIAAVIFVARTVIDYFIKNSKVGVKRLWHDLILPILPVFVGAFSGYFVKSYPYPNDLTSNGNRVVFGLVAGLLSGLIYRVIKSLINQKIPKSSSEK